MVLSPGFGSPDPSLTSDLMSDHPAVTLAVPSAEGALTSSSISSVIYFRALAQLDTHQWDCYFGALWQHAAPPDPKGVEGMG